MKTEAIEACIRQVEADLYRGCPAAERARAELVELKGELAYLKDSAAHDLEHKRELVALKARSAPSPEPAAKTELTAEELREIREEQQMGCDDPECPARRTRDDNDCLALRVAKNTRRLLDEHAAMRKELERLHANNAATCDALDIRTTQLDTAQHRIAELESALAIATEAVAAEARAKVEGLTVAEDLIEAIDGYMNSTQADSSFALKGPAANRVRDLLKSWARREAAKAKGDGNG